MDVLEFDIPYPPTVNHYYLRTSSGVIIGAKGRKYRRDVGFILYPHRGLCSADLRLNVIINVFPPDKRRRDIDNILKCCLDSIQYAKVFHDDNQIDVLTVIRREIVEHGRLSVWINECS